MVNNNGIPFEVKKPFETVYEIKNETPSFEEFMKTYENDGNLNYDDLSGGSVGEVKGCGPCERYCSRKDDPKCKCYRDDGYIPLNSACPSCNYAPSTKHQWYHNWCGGQMYISTSAYIKCMKCPKEMKWREWLFKCDHVEHKSYEKITNPQLFISALNIASSLGGDDPRTQEMILEIGYAILKDSLNK